MPTNGFDTKLVKDLAKILCDSELSEIEIDYNGTKIKVARTNTLVAQVQSYAAPTPAAAPQAPAAAPVASPVVVEAAKNYQTSPMVGTVYLSPEPGAKQFAQIGDKIKEGQQLFIIEAMKTMNAVNATSSGVLKEILVKDGQPVEFGENLCVIE